MENKSVAPTGVFGHSPAGSRCMVCGFPGLATVPERLKAFLFQFCMSTAWHVSTHQTQHKDFGKAKKRLILNEVLFTVFFQESSLGINTLALNLPIFLSIPKLVSVSVTKIITFFFFVEWPFILKGSFTFKLLEAYKIFISTSYSPQRKKMDQKELSSHKARKKENPFPFYPVGGP